MTVHLIYCFRLQAVKGSVSTHFQVTKRYKEVIIRTPTSFCRSDLGEDNKARYYTGMEQKHRRLRTAAFHELSRKHLRASAPENCIHPKYRFFKVFI